MDVYLASPRGFCAGVVRAVEVVDRVLEQSGSPVYVKHQIVHNPYVVGALEAKGAITVEDLQDVPEHSVVVFSAHGSPPEDYRKAKERRLRVIDATCPLVTKVHNEARKYAQDGRRVILVGHRGHAEVRGTMGQAPMALVDDREEFELPPWEDETPVAVLTQTTLSVDDTQKAAEAISNRFPNSIVRNDLCYATTNRQAAVKDLAKHVDMVLVIGSQISSNCHRLREVAEAHGLPAYMVNGPEELDPQWLNGIQRVGITSGASTPEFLEEQVIKALQPERVVVLPGPQEDVKFTLPKEIR